MRYMLSTLAVLMAMTGLGFGWSAAWATQDEASLRAARDEAVRMRDDLNRRIAEIDRQLGEGTPNTQTPVANGLAAMPTSRTSRFANPAATESRSYSPGSPTCFVGPRGGTYTITKSGRKNYGGC